MKTDDVLKHRLNRWQIEPLSETQQERIVHHVLAQPQHVLWTARLHLYMMETFGQWQAGLAYKLAALVLCAFAGTFTGFHQVADTPDTTLLVWGDVDWIGNI